MRILIATDGSEHGDHAVRLAAAQPWPEGTELRVLVADDGRLLSSALLVETPVAVDLVGAGLEDLSAIGRRAAEIVTGPGWAVDWQVVRGRVASVIVEQAASWDADLVVVGSRGRGALGSLTLGSVSAEVVDHAGRPVLVGRGVDRFERVLLADDGSETAAVARRLVAGWPVFKDAVITVTGVVDVPPPLHSAIAPTVYRAALADYTRTLDEARTARELTLAAAAAELSATGRTVTTVPREGNPAEVILDVAESQGTQLIVVGSRGDRGLTRLLLGSVARDVLYEARCSVLIAR